MLVPHLEAIDLPLRFTVEKVGKPVEHVYFPDAGMVSVVVDLGTNHQAEAGTIGWDLFTGHSVVMGGGVSLTTLYLQIAGNGRRMPATVFAKLLQEDRELHECFLAAVEGFNAQATYTIITNSRGKLEERLCRWLLMAHDRSEGDTLGITHDLLSVMLGVRRAGVTTALQHLEDSQAVKLVRGKITILDRGKLKGFAGPFYGPAETAQARLTGWQPKPFG
ncbi:MAG: Crp/Fnr family transcriptional regulator [Alphaproteobacteria bacterium]|nr:Crp/Fnr family transcriptional regulator [Alphaproteobacteria bacterium]